MTCTNQCNRFSLRNLILKPNKREKFDFFIKKIYQISIRQMRKKAQRKSSNKNEIVDTIKVTQCSLAKVLPIWPDSGRPQRYLSILFQLNHSFKFIFIPIISAIIFHSRPVESAALSSLHSSDSKKTQTQI